MTTHPVSRDESYIHSFSSFAQRIGNRPQKSQNRTQNAQESFIKVFYALLVFCSVPFVDVPGSVGKPSSTSNSKSISGADQKPAYRLPAAPHFRRNKETFGYGG